jgi:F-type H+-transporting ATPase subunit epsilon
MKQLSLKVITPEKVVSETRVVSITLPTKEGEITVLPEHIPYVGVLKAGEVVFRTSTNEVQHLATSGGFMEFHDNELTLLLDTAEHAEEIDIERAEEAKARAERLMQDRVRFDDEDYARVVASLEKQLARLHIARKHRH